MQDGQVLVRFYGTASRLHTQKQFPHSSYVVLIPEAVRSKAQVFGRSPAEIVGSNPTRGMDVCLL